MNPVKAWNRFFFAPISAKPLGAFRIVFGLLILYYLALMPVEFDYWYSNTGLLQGTEAREAAGPFRFSALQYFDSPLVARSVFAATVAAAVGFTLGWRTRVMSVLLYLGMLTLYHRNVSSIGGPDAVPLIFSFYAMLCPCGKAFSLDAHREARKLGVAAEPLIIPWAMRLLQMQLCLIYFQSSVIKVQGPLWLNGQTVHHILFLHEFREFNMEWMAQYPFLINVMTHGAILGQFALAFWLWFRPTRRWAIVIGLIFHAGLAMILNIAAFGETMMSVYLTFLAPDEIDSLIHALDPRGWLARLGVRMPSFLGWRSARSNPALTAYRQLEFPFDGVEASAGAGTVSAG